MKKILLLLVGLFVFNLGANSSDDSERIYSKHERVITEKAYATEAGAAYVVEQIKSVINNFYKDHEKQKLVCCFDIIIEKDGSVTANHHCNTKKRR